MPKYSSISDSNPELQRRRSPSFLKRLESLDLFNNLLFNRERVYQGLKRLSPVRYEDEASQNRAVENETRIVQSIEDEEGTPNKGVSIKPYLKTTSMAVTRSRGTPLKKASAKAKAKGGSSVATTKKRSPSSKTRNERATKIQKIMPKANSSKRVNGGASIVDAYVISDSEDEDTERQVTTDSLTPPRQPLKIDSPGSKDDSKPTAMPTLTPTPTHSHNSENELTRLKVAHAKEIEHLQQQLHTSQANIRATKETAEQRALDIQRRQSITSSKQTADSSEELGIQRRLTSDLTWECDHLRKEIEATRSCLKGELDLIQQRDEYERLLKEEQDTNAELTRGLEEKDREATRRDEGIASEIQQLGKQIADLQREVSDLRSENAALRGSANEPAAEVRASPTPSVSSSQLTSASDTDVKLANVRKTYITVKKKYDSLHSVASNISTAARSLDYGSFGEFGAYLRQLKTVLDENGPEGRSTAKIV